MVENEESLKEIIIEYVLKNLGCSQSCIINYMRGYDAVGPVEEKSRITIVSQTTLNLLKILTGKEGNETPILVALPSKKNRRYLEYYVIDDLKTINDQLRDIESLISMMDFPIHKLNKIKFTIDKLPGEYPKQIPITHPDLFDYARYAPYMVAYSAAVRTMLYYLFEKLSIIKIPKEHSNIFYYKIIELIRTLSNQTLETQDPSRDLKLPRKQFFELKKELNTDLTAKYYFNQKIVDKFTATLDGFDKRF
jgi:hypothetical protein